MKTIYGDAREVSSSFSKPVKATNDGQTGAEVTQTIVWFVSDECIAEEKARVEADLADLIADKTAVIAEKQAVVNDIDALKS